MHYETRFTLTYRIIPRLAALIVIIVITLELALGIADPLATVARWRSMWTLYDNLQVNERGWVQGTGHYTLRGWDVRIRTDNTRYVPATNELADCTIAFAGDSVTFSSGVSDNEAWVNLVAGQLQDVTVRNLALYAYNATQVRQSIENYPADGYVYLLFGNDATGSPHETIRVRWWWYSALVIYWRHWTPALPAVNEAAYIEAVTALDQRDDVLIMAFRDNIDDLQAMTTVHVDVWLPYWSQTVSLSDYHANAVGNQEIASAAVSQVETFINQVC